VSRFTGAEVAAVFAGQGSDRIEPAHPALGSHPRFEKADNERRAVMRESPERWHVAALGAFSAEGKALRLATGRHRLGQTPVMRFRIVEPIATAKGTADRARKPLPRSTLLPRDRRGCGAWLPLPPPTTVAGVA
jgi:hypothetical protein